MLKRWFAFAIVTIFLVLTFVPSQAQSQSVFWERWDVIIDEIDTTNNSFRVQEIYDVRFDGTFRFGQRIIEDNRLDNITNVQVYEDGRRLQASCDDSTGTYCVENVPEGLSITYYFNRAITNNNQDFTIEYTVEGALRVYDDGDQLSWFAIPDEHFGFGIGESTITVYMPDGYEPREGIDPIETYGAPSEISVRGNVVEAVATRQIGGSESFEIRIQYPHDPNASAPDWQSFQEGVLPWLNIGIIALSLLLGIGGILAVFALWYNKGRDPKVGPVPEYLTELPSDMPPAIIGALIDEKADVRDVISTLIHLASRGYIVIEEDRTEGVVFGIGAKSSFVFKRTDKDLGDLRKYERNIVQKVFKSGMERSMESLKNKFYSYMPQLQNDLYDALVAEGFFTTSPQTIRSMWTVLAVVIVGAAIFLGFLLFPQTEAISMTLLCLPLSLGGAGLAALIASQHMPAKTREGALEAAKWNAFLRYIDNVEKYQDLEDAAVNFDDYLAYAVAFGLDKSWIRRFAKVPSTSVPVWYFPTYRGGHYSGGYTAGTSIPRPSTGGGGFTGDLARASGEGGGFSLDDMAGDLTGGLESISSGLTNMLESASQTFTSKPQSTSGGSGSWSGGGRTWSGGGSFGGGSSGGGSSGFG